MDTKEYNTEWNQAKKALKALGITVKTSLKGCCVGCQDNGISDDEPALYQMRKRFGLDGGYVNHQHIAGTPRATILIAVLDYYGIPYEWDGTNGRAILINL